MFKSIIKRVVNYVLNGLLIAVPVAVTVFVVYKIFIYLDNLLENIIPEKYKFPGAGIASLVICLFLLGFLGSKLINEPLKRRFDKFLDRIPLIKTVYKSMTDVLGAFVGSKKRFDQPVLVRLSKTSDPEVIGFVTDKDLHELGEGAIGKIAVYIPMSFSISGHLIVVPKENVSPIDRNAVDVMKYVISGGVVEIDKDDEKV
ncbi:MAG: DUF502 domain-containing protein [Flavobacteriales bacterium]|nr:DUF502 domain-containing protein [Flavobacteriales bacterium]